MYSNENNLSTQTMNQACQTLCTVSDFIRWATSCFNQAELYFGHGTDNALDEAIALILDALHLPNDFPDRLWNTRLLENEKEVVVDLVRRRIQERVPVPYLTQHAWFAGLRFHVNSQVLIPRSPIAELIEQRFEPWINPDEVNYMLDLCTGSGCIAIASALLALPHAQIDATDISPEALQVAQQNIEYYDLSVQVQIIQSDLFSALQGRKYDLIICNPPYVSAQDLATIPFEYRHEPRLGLAGGLDGLEYVKPILSQAANYLNDKGILILEVGASQTALIQQYPTLPFLWLEFKRGGEGIFLLTAQQLRQARLNA